jgi:hypothetical protein
MCRRHVVTCVGASNGASSGESGPQGLKPAFLLALGGTTEEGAEKLPSRGEGVTSAAKAVDENKPVIAAVNRCAAQNQVQHRFFPQPVKPCPFKACL